MSLLYSCEHHHHQNYCHSCKPQQLFHQQTCFWNKALDRILWEPSFLPSAASASFNASNTILPRRAIPRLPDRILDAPGLRQDIFSTPISWCRQKSILAVALDSSVYLWEEKSGTIFSQLTPVTSISSIHWISSSLLVVGCCNGHILLWEYTLNRQLYLKKDANHSSINFIAHGPCGTIIAGDTKGNLFFFFSSGVKSEKKIHAFPIAFISFDHYGMLVTSDTAGAINIWRISESLSSASVYTCILKYLSPTSQNYPLKAISWCPWRPSVLAVAGSSSISLWNVLSGACFGEARLLDSSFPPIALHWWHSDVNCLPLIIVVHLNYEISLWSIPIPQCITRIKPEFETSIIHTCWTGTRLISITTDERIQFHSFSQQPPTIPSGVGTQAGSRNLSPSPNTITPSVNSIPSFTSPSKHITSFTSPLKNIVSINSPSKAIGLTDKCKNSPNFFITNQISPVSNISPTKSCENGVGLFSPESRKLLFDHSQ